LGAVLVLGSVLIGARVMASADNTVAVWQVAHDIPAGADVGAADLRVTHVHFDESSASQQYLVANAPLGIGYHAVRDLKSGELLSVTSLSSGPTATTRQLPLGVGSTHQPADLRAGDHVDVWVVSSGSGVGRSSTNASSLVLHDVVVLSVSADPTGISGEHQVLVGISSQVDVGAVLRAMTGSQIVLVRLAG
jgi:hypothetical protein